jgi:hypothetical protein
MLNTYRVYARKFSWKIILRALPVLVVAGVLLSILPAFCKGWSQMSTDFPNYYTAAALVRRHEPLRKYYDWTWFARQMNYMGFETQLGAYAAQTPLTMLPMMELTGLRPLTAKRAWLLLNVVFLVSVVVMLASMTRIRWELITLLLLFGVPSFAANFALGQYYIFLLFLICVTVYAFDRSITSASGFIAGVGFALKLYTAPLLLYFAVTRKWKSAIGMLVATVVLGGVAVALFGWSDVFYYVRHVLPRSLAGGSIDPYNPGVPTISTFIWRAFMEDPALNPHPLLKAPWLFFFGRTAVQLGIMTFAILGAASTNVPNHHRGLAWFVIASVLLSTSAGSYSFVLLLAPVVLLLRGSPLWKASYLVFSYVLLTHNLKPLWLFPKVWVLLLLFFVVGAEYWQRIPPRWKLCGAIVVVLLSITDAYVHMRDYAREPGRRYAQIGVKPGDLFAGYPALTRFGLFYQGMGDAQRGQGYVIRWAHDSQIDTLLFDGHALHPQVSPDGVTISFELVAHGTSTLMLYDPRNRSAIPAPFPNRPATADSVTSPDGKWAAFTQISANSEHLWIKDLRTGRKQELAAGSCNSSSPVWKIDSSAVIFASDCGRAFGLSALYLAPISVW